MSKRIVSSKLNLHVGEQVMIQGWLHKKRDVSSKLVFIMLRDRVGIVQVVVEEVTEIAKLNQLQIGSVLTIRGIAVSEPRAVLGMEIHEVSITVEVPIIHPSPIEIDKDLSHNSEHYDTLFEYRTLGLRNLKEQSVFRIQAEVYEQMRVFLRQNEFVEIRSPKILAEATEGGSETFTLDYFGKKATLAQSAQFYKQIMVGVFERVFEIGATYRAEPSYTPRHMTEFTTLDVEMGFIQNFEEVLEVAENLLKKVSHETFTTCQTELEMWNASPPVIVDKIPKISMNDLHKLYFEQTGIDLRSEKDPSPEEERFICEYARSGGAKLCL